MDKSHSGFGIVSFVLAMLIWVGLIGLMLMAEFTGDDEIESDSPFAIALGIGVIAFLLMWVLSICLGITCILQSGRRKVFGVLGITLSTIAILLTLGMILIGHSSEETATPMVPPTQSGS